MDSVHGGHGGLPLAGAILCCTSIAQEERTLLGTIGAQMGATIKLDLTSDVTHLIVGSTESAKYRYVAKSRGDVKVLSPTWLEALRELWMEGADSFDLAALEDAHRLPTFYGLRICLTGFDNPDQRRYIQDQVNQNGAEYHGDLTKAVTHLIAASPTGKKYEHALSWRMKIVSLEWFNHSLERGMILDEAYYNPRMPAEQRGVGAWDHRDCPPSPGLGKRARETEQNESLNPFRRKLRRSASTRLGSQSEALWAGITAASLEKPHNDDDDWTEASINQQDNSRHNPLVARNGDIAALQEDSPVAVDPVDRRQPAELAPRISANDGIFKGCVICAYGFDKDKTDILRQHTVEKGARFVHQRDLDSYDKDDLKSGYLVVPFDNKVDLSALPDGAGLMALVTNLWVERCLFGKRLIDPAEDILSRPLDNLSINGFSGLTINSTGFVGIELLHVTKVVSLMGATYDEQLSTKTSVVICRSGRPSEQKLKFATERRIPAVHATWLWECVRTGKVQPYSNFQLNTLPPVQLAKSKSKQREQSSADVPTARLSTEESFEMQQKKIRPAKTVSKTRGPQQPRTLELALSVDPTPDSTTDSVTHANTNSLELDQDDGVIPGFDGHGSMPLQDISANSPRRPSTESLASKPVSRARSSSAESLIRPETRRTRATKQPTPESYTLAKEESSIPPESGPESESLSEHQPQPPEEKDYSDILAQLRANRKPLPSAAEQATNRRRGRRQLGRATSVRSNQSTAESSGGALNLDESEDRDQAVVYQPSQELGWDSPGAAKAREQMIKRLGGRVTETSVRVEGIGIVRDGPSELGAGRSGRSRRTKGF